MKTVNFYNQNGTLLKELPMDRNSIEQCHGMKIRCILIDGSIREGFANPFYSFEKGEIVIAPQGYDYIALETFVNLDEETHTFVGDTAHKFDISRDAVPISLISHIDAILYSGLRWGGVRTNKFNLEIKP